MTYCDRYKVYAKLHGLTQEEMYKDRLRNYTQWCNTKWLEFANHVSQLAGHEVSVAQLAWYYGDNMHKEFDKWLELQVQGEAP